jgi:hypothetical protein
MAREARHGSFGKPKLHSGLTLKLTRSPVTGPVDGRSGTCIIQTTYREDRGEDI